METTEIIKIKEELLRKFPQQKCRLEVENHTYYMGHTKMHSVSSLLAPISVGIKKIPKAILDAAAKRGSYIHDIVDRINKDLDTMANYTDVPDVTFYFNSLTQLGIVPVLSEFRVWDEPTKLAGTIDLIGVDKDGNLCIIDLKTGSIQKNTHDLQLDLYAWLLAAPPKHRKIIIYTNAKQRAVREVAFNEKNIDTKNALMHIFNYNKEHKEI